MEKSPDDPDETKSGSSRAECIKVESNERLHITKAYKHFDARDKGWTKVILKPER